MLLQHRGDRREPRLEQRKSSENWASLQAQNFGGLFTLRTLLHSVTNHCPSACLCSKSREKNHRAQPAGHSASSELRFLAGAGADLHRKALSTAKRRFAEVRGSRCKAHERSRHGCQNQALPNATAMNAPATWKHRSLQCKAASWVRLG